MSESIRSEHVQADLYGYGLKDLVPFNTLADEVGDTGRSDDSSQLKDVYTKWLKDSPYSRQICFLDLTFGPESGRYENSQVKTVIAAPSAETVKLYKQEFLTEMFKTGKSLTAHPVFRAGLPMFSPERTKPPATSEGEASMPQDAEHLRAWRKTRDLVDDGWLSSKLDVELKSCIPAELDDVAFVADITRTFTGPLEYGSGDSLGTVSEVWETCSEVARKHSNFLPSKRGQNLGHFIALPLGLRDPLSPTNYSWIADIYIGFDYKSELNEMSDFVRRLLLFLLRTNSSQKTKREALQQVISNFGHEVTRVTRILGSSWVVPATKLFDLRTFGTNEEEAVTQEKMGWLTLSKNYREFPIENLLVVPFGSLLNAAHLTIELWTWQSLQMRLPRPILHYGPLPPPKTWQDLMDYAWALARDQQVMLELGDETYVDGETLLRTQQTLESKVESYANQKPSPENFADAGGSQWLDRFPAPEFLWSTKDTEADPDEEAKNNERIKASFSLLRVLLAWFANCVQHGSRTQPISFYLAFAAPSDDRTPRFLMTIKNKPGDKEGSGSNPLSSFRGPARASSTREVIRLSMTEVQGNANYRDDGEYEFSLNFAWPDRSSSLAQPSEEGARQT